VVNEFNVGMVEMRQVPWAETDRFLDPASARVIYGEELPAHSAVDA
jgi:hypothetical protein